MIKFIAFIEEVGDHSWETMRPLNQTLRDMGNYYGGQGVDQGFLSWDTEVLKIPGYVYVNIICIV